MILVALIWCCWWALLAWRAEWHNWSKKDNDPLNYTQTLHPPFLESSLCSLVNLANLMPNIDYYTSLESYGCQISNATGSTSIGSLQLELYSMEGEEVSWPDCMLVLCSSMHITGLFSPSIFSIHHACHICLESSRCLLSNAFWITSFGVL